MQLYGGLSVKDQDQARGPFYPNLQVFFFKKMALILEFGNETDNFFSDLIPAAGILLPPPFQLPCLPATEWKPVDN